MDLTALRLEHYNVTRLRKQCDARLERLEHLIQELEAQPPPAPTPTPPPDPPEDL